MAIIKIDEQALADADAFLTSYLSEKVPEADFSKGGVMRDFVITAVAYIFAFLEQERKTTRDQQSLLTLATLTDSQAVQDAVNALLSNWFISRKTGKTARMTATLHFSAAADIPLTPTTQFFRTSTLVYFPDAPADFVIPAASLVPTFNADNIVTEYIATVNLVAAEVGTQYNVPAGRFVVTDQFSPYFTYAENQSAVTDGKSIETTPEILARAPTAITVRNLVNSRSIDTVLRDTFAGITRVLSIGFGDAEMLRDFSSESVTRLRMHVGGYVDIYTQLPISEVVETGTVGGVFTRPDNTVVVFKDSAANFLAGPAVLARDILRITTGLPNVPREYIIETVATTTLTVSPRASFSEATDEAGTYCGYTIGNTAPNFDDKRSVTALPISLPTSGGKTSRTISTSGRITLQGRPHYRIKKVELFETIDPSTVELVAERVNTAPAVGQYRVISSVPAQAQSAYAVDEVEVNLTGRTNGLSQVRVTYDTLVGYADVQALVISSFDRILASNPLAKGYTPVYITMSIAYRMRVGSTSVLDTKAAAQSVATYINTFNLQHDLDLTAIQQNLRDTYTEIGVIVSPTVLTYTLFAPDGQVYKYSTQDIVTIFPSSPSNNAHLANGTSLRVPINNADLDPTSSNDAATLFAAANKELNDQLLALGVSDRTLVYVTTANDITLTRVT